MHTGMLFNVNNFANMISKGVEISERISAILSHFDISLNRLANRTGVHLNTLRKLYTGETKNISDETARRLCEKYPIRWDFIKHGIGELIEKNEKEDYNIVIQKQSQTIALLTETLGLYRRIEELEKENQMLKLELFRTKNN